MTIAPITYSLASDVVDGWKVREILTFSKIKIKNKNVLLYGYKYGLRQ